MLKPRAGVYVRRIQPWDALDAGGCGSRTLLPLACLLPATPSPLQHKKQRWCCQELSHQGCSPQLGAWEARLTGRKGVPLLGLPDYNSDMHHEAGRPVQRTACIMSCTPGQVQVTRQVVMLTSLSTVKRLLAVTCIPQHQNCLPK